MGPVTDARAAAVSVPFGSPPYQLAVTICQLRNINPDASGASGLSNWQAVIMETLLIEILDTMVS